MVEQFRDDLQASRSKAMTNKTLSALSSIVKEAKRLGYVNQNAAAGVKVARPNREVHRPIVPTQQELRRLLAATNGRDRLMLLVAIATGMRSSEIRGLRWQDIDADHSLICVRQRADDWGNIGPPKSAAGTRDIPVAAEVMQALIAVRHSAGVAKDALVFPSRAGTPLRHNNMLRRLFIPAQLHAGLFAPWRSADGALRHGPNGECLLTGKFTFHALRHAAASNWINAGVDLKRLQVWLGHSSVQMTIDRYGHLLADRERDAAFAEHAARELLGA
jgi:integrase